MTFFISPPAHTCRESLCGRLFGNYSLGGWSNFCPAAALQSGNELTVRSWVQEPRPKWVETGSGHTGYHRHFDETSMLWLVSGCNSLGVARHHRTGAHRDCLCRCPCTVFVGSLAVSFILSDPRDRFFGDRFRDRKANETETDSLVTKSADRPRSTVHFPAVCVHTSDYVCILRDQQGSLGFATGQPGRTN